MSDLVLTDRAALALVDEAEKALASVTSPDDADELWRKVKAVEEAARLARVSEVAVLGLRRVQLRAKRRYGELLPDPEPSNAGRPKKSEQRVRISDADRVSASRARALAAVPQETFEETIAVDSIEKVSEAAIHRAHKRDNRPAPEPVAPAEGTFEVLYADPPWRYAVPGGQTPDLRSVENHYPTMTIEEIAALEVPGADDAVLFLWATNPLLREALSIMDAWGFVYKTNFCWGKDRVGMGYYVRGQHELLLIGRRGDIGTPSPADRPPSLLLAPRQEHSRKPDDFYGLIERMYPDRSKVELFARRERDGWESWGNQVGVAA